MKEHIAVIMGGYSAERDVSLLTGKAVISTLKNLGYTVTPIDLGANFSSQISKCNPDIVFNALHGKFGEDGCIQGFLEIMKIPYTHSGVLASAIAMNKPTAKYLFSNAGLRCPEGQVSQIMTAINEKTFPLPYVIKPLNEGSSVGVHIIQDKEALISLSQEPWPHEKEVLVEEYIPGREIQVAVMGERALGAIEICPRGQFYDYETKYTEGKAEHFMPAPIHPQSYAEALDVALKAHRILGCRGVSRADFRYNDKNGEPGTLYLLEVNTQPGLTPLSLVPEIAAYSGIKFSELISWMVENASCDN